FVLLIGHTRLYHALYVSVKKVGVETYIVLLFAKHAEHKTYVEIGATLRIQFITGIYVFGSISKNLTASRHTDGFFGRSRKLYFWKQIIRHCRSIACFVACVFVFISRYIIAATHGIF